MRNMTRPSQSETSTKRLVWELAATGVLILVLYYPTLKALVSDWNIDPNYSHGFFHTFSGWLIFIIAFALLFAVGIILRKTAYRS